MLKITVSEDIRSCPNCAAEAVKTDATHRQCNSCGTVWEFVNAEEEQERMETLKLRGRGWADEHGRSRAIPHGANRW